jgi:hypothetical protein
MTCLGEQEFWFPRRERQEGERNFDLSFSQCPLAQSTQHSKVPHSGTSCSEFQHYSFKFKLLFYMSEIFYHLFLGSVKGHNYNNSEILIGFICDSIIKQHFIPQNRISVLIV